jgi:hypothetical protein
VNYQHQLFDVGRTGTGWAVLHQNTLKLENRNWSARFFETDTPTVETLRWRWQHVYSFDPLPSASKVLGPVLGLFGALDTSTPAQVAEANMHQALKGNADLTVRVFQHANHSLTIATTRAEEENKNAPGLVPEVLATLRDLLQKRAITHDFPGMESRLLGGPCRGCSAEENLALAKGP